MKRIECNCSGFVAIGPDNIEHGHHTNCDTNTEKKELVKLTYDGTWCIMRFDDAIAELRENVNGDEYTFQKVWFTQNEFDTMPEFTGW